MFVGDRKQIPNRGSDTGSCLLNVIATSVLPADPWLVCGYFRRLRATRAQTLNLSAEKQPCGLWGRSSVPLKITSQVRLGSQQRWSGRRNCFKKSSFHQQMEPCSCSRWLLAPANILWSNCPSCTQLVSPLVFFWSTLPQIINSLGLGLLFLWQTMMLGWIHLQHYITIKHYFDSDTFKSYFFSGLQEPSRTLNNFFPSSL